MHYFTFNIGDYLSHTQHLDEMEDLAYRRMIEWCYLHESALPDKIDQIAKLIRMRSHTESIAAVLDEFFILGDYGYFQPRIKEEIAKYHEKSEKAKKSAEARWNKKTGSKPAKSNADAQRAQSERNANHKPITNNQEPYIAFDNFWSIYPRKTGKKQAEKAWEKLKPSTELFAKIQSHIGKQYPDDYDKNYIPHPATYLNNERWEDEIIERPKEETQLKLPADDQLVGFAANNGLPGPNEGESFFEYRRRLQGHLDRMQKNS